MPIRISRQVVAKEIQNVAQSTGAEEATYQGPRRVSDDDVPVVLPLGRNVPFPVDYRITFFRQGSVTVGATDVVLLGSSSSNTPSPTIPPGFLGRLRAIRIYVQNDDTSPAVLNSVSLALASVFVQQGEGPRVESFGTSSITLWGVTGLPVNLEEGEIHNVPASDLQSALNYIWYPGEQPILKVSAPDGAAAEATANGVMEFTPLPFVPTHSV